MENRSAYISQLTRPGEKWDVIVIGGGSSGLGIGLEAATRGYKTLVVEQSDFAKGTSGRSTKLVHGGVRYLAQGNFRLVREASIERGLLYRNAPHLVKNQAFIIPVYSLFDKIKYTIGLKLYDLVAGRLSMGRSRFISRNEAINKLPGIRHEGLKGAIEYYDGQFDDARLAISLMQTIIDHGGQAINYMRVTGLTKDASGKVNGITAVDEESRMPVTLSSSTVVNATGVFVDDILQMDLPGVKKSISVSQGIHLVLDRSFYPSDHALMIPRTSDGRVLFAVPWHNRIVVGTTDTPVAAASLEPKAQDAEIDFIIDTAGGYFLNKPQREDVLSVFAGLRPLAAAPKKGQKTREISRSHRIVISTSGLFTILGGKWTTFRKMGQDMIDRIENTLQWQHRPSVTANLPVHGYTKHTDWKDPFYVYGSDAKSLQRDHRPWLSESLEVHPVQVEYAVRYEMARTVEDVLSRRTRALILDAKESIRIAPAVAALMAPLLEKDNAWIQSQIHSFNQLAANYLLH